jgi:thioredoxin 1
MSDLIQVVGSEDFGAATQSGVVLVDFFASWCRPCRMQLPILEQLAPNFEGKVKFVKVDTDQAQDLAVRFGVQSIPMLVILKEGKKVTQFVGVQQAETLKTALERALV